MENLFVIGVFLTFVVTSFSQSKLAAFIELVVGKLKRRMGGRKRPTSIKYGVLVLLKR